jgi:molybdopterin-guanine dinucleotide biosynthesis protein A
MKDVAVIVLAGGRGSRIGGAKPLKLLRGERLIDRALKFARTCSDPLAVAVRDEQQARSINADIVHDSAIEGPLGGLIAGLGFASYHGLSSLLAIPADMPFLPRDLLDRLAGEIGSNACAIASSGGHLHPVCGLWRTDVLDRVPGYIAIGGRSLHGLAELVGHRAIKWPVEPFDPFFNINSEEDLAEAERLLSG